MDAESLQYTIPFQLTKKIRRDPYDAIKDISATGKIIVITGGGTGIGAVSIYNFNFCHWHYSNITEADSRFHQAAAKVWARAGARGVVIAGRRVDKLEETASEIRTLSNGKIEALAVQTDLVRDTDVENLFAQIIKTFGRSPDVVLANAGAVESVAIGEQNTDDWWNIVVWSDVEM